MADRLCKGCGKTYGTFRSYNAHHSRTDAKPGCRGRHNEQSATATVNSRSYRVVVRDSSFHPEADSDHSRAESDLESAAGSLAGPPLQAGPGPRLAGGRSAPRPALADADGAGHDGGWPGGPGRHGRRSCGPVARPWRTCLTRKKIWASARGRRLQARSGLQAAVTVQRMDLEMAAQEACRKMWITRLGTAVKVRHLANTSVIH